MGISKINYKNKEILYIDYSPIGADKQKVLDLLKEAEKEYSAKRNTHSILALINVENIKFDMELLNAFKSTRVLNAAKKEGLIGVKGLLKAASNFVVGLTSANTKYWDTEQEAKEWLVQD